MATDLMSLISAANPEEQEALTQLIGQPQAASPNLGMLNAPQAPIQTGFAGLDTSNAIRAQEANKEFMAKKQALAQEAIKRFNEGDHQGAIQFFAQINPEIISGPLGAALKTGLSENTKLDIQTKQGVNPAQLAELRGSKAHKQIRNLIDPSTGKVASFIVDPETGGLTPIGQTGFAGQFRTNPATGGIVNLTPSEPGGAPREVGLPGSKVEQTKDGKNVSLTPKQNTRLVELSDELLKDSKDLRTSVESITTLKSILDLNNPLSASAVKTQFPRLLGEVGNLNQTEQEAFGGSKALKDRIAQTMETWSSGKLTTENKKFMNQLLKTLGEKAQAKLQARAELFISKGASDTQLDPEIVRKRIMPSELTSVGQKTDMVAVKDPNGRQGSIPRAKLKAALKQGYKQVGK